VARDRTCIPEVCIKETSGAHHHKQQNQTEEVDRVEPREPEPDKSTVLGDTKFLRKYPVDMRDD